MKIRTNPRNAYRGETAQNREAEYATGEFLKRFSPYYKPYLGILCIDLICAALTTLCDLVLPMIIRNLTNTGMTSPELLTMQMVLRLAALYFVLKIVECAANFYMANTGHVMGARIEAYAHLQRLSDRYYNNTKVGQIMVF